MFVRRAQQPSPIDCSPAQGTRSAATTVRLTPDKVVATEPGSSASGQLRGNALYFIAVSSLMNVGCSGEEVGAGVGLGVGLLTCLLVAAKTHSNSKTERGAYLNGSVQRMPLWEPALYVQNIRLSMINHAGELTFWGTIGTTLFVSALAAAGGGFIGSLF